MNRIFFFIYISISNAVEILIESFKLSRWTILLLQFPGWNSILELHIILMLIFRAIEIIVFISFLFLIMCENIR